MNFWDVHPSGLIFLFFIAVLPRLTMLVTGICFAPFAGILFWIGWFLAPRLTVAILASMFYWRTNPVLVIFAWLIALGGESGEKKTTTNVVHHHHFH